MATRLAKRRKIPAKTSECMDNRFVLRSAAEIERVFSVGNSIFSQHRRLMTLRLFEALMFLESNQRFWAEDLVADAVHQTRRPRDGWDQA